MHKRNEAGLALILELILIGLVITGIATVFIRVKKTAKQSKPISANDGGSTKDCKVSFTAPPVALKDLAAIFPMGKMSGHGHITPTDHQYWIPVGLTGNDNYIKIPDRYAVYAPADGTITTVGHLPDTINGVRVNDFQVSIDYECGVHSANMHIGKLAPTLQAEFDRSQRGEYASVSIPVKAGEQIGSFGPRNLDFMVWNDNEILAGFVDPKDYQRESWKPHIIDSFSLFTEPLKSQLIAKSMRKAEPVSGKIDYDKDGYLVGNWFLEGCDSQNTTNPGLCDMAIAYDPIQPANIIVSLAEFGGDSKPYAVKGNFPDPATVGVASSPTAYELVGWQWRTAVGEWRDFWGPGYDNVTFRADSNVQGTVLFQLTEKRQLKMEAFPGKTKAQVTGFTSAAKVYER